jgi:serine protease Do
MNNGVQQTHRLWVIALMMLLLALGNALPAAAATPFNTPQLALHSQSQAAGVVPFQQAPVPKPKPGDDQGIAGDAPVEELVEEAADDSLAVGNLDDVESAVVQIEAVGTFADPAEGMIMNAAGMGSGFIIDPAGIAVTNNHVVTGAAFLKVYVAGERKPRNARVLGVSECSDLAVIDIQGGGYPFLTWSKQRVKVGLEIYAAGFPLGDPEFTLTRGIIAKANADGESSWASVDHVIQHDAATNPGNSGGPIVDKDGGVIAVHYAGNHETNQYFAIAIDEALPVLEQLRAGYDVDSIGINGEAVQLGEEMTGIWVASVASGSIADQTGIKPGDVMITMEGISLASEGAMTEYCDILRSHDPTDVMAVQVLRIDTKEVLEGQLNGRPLEVKFSLADVITESGEEPTGQGAAATYDDYVTITDDSGLLSVEVPTAWGDVDGGPWVSNDEEIGVRVMASPDLDALRSGWDTPGLFFGASATLATDTSVEELLDSIDYNESCEYDGRKAFPEGFYVGSYDLWHTCGDAESVAAVVGLTPESGAYLVLLQIYAVSDADLDALDHILATFLVDQGAQATGGSTGGEAPLTNVETDDLAYDYEEVSEPALTALFPTDYGDRQSSDWTVDDEVVGVTLAVARDIDDYFDTWTGPGVYVRSATGFTEDVDFDEWLDAYDLSDDCKRGDRIKHSHTANGLTYTGAYDIWLDCDGSGNAFIHLIAVTEPADHLVMIDFQAADEADLEALTVLLESFYVDAASSTGQPTTNTNPLEYQYTEVSDDTGNLVVKVPTTWSDVNGGPWVMDDEEVGISVSASPDLDKYNSTWNTEGMFYGATTTLAQTGGAEALLDMWDYSDECDDVERLDYDDALFVGLYDLYSGCGGQNLFVVLAAQFKERANLLVLLQIAIPAGSSEEPFEQILASFTLNSQGVIDATSEQSANITSEPADEGPTAQVLVPTLNVRSGPGTNYTRIGAVNNGERLVVTGQFSNCSWLQVTTLSGASGWISGGQQFVRLDGDCAKITAVAAPPPPSTTSGGSSSSAAGSNQACVTFRNNLGAELNVTFTRSSDRWNKNFKVPGHNQRRECFDPGKYTLTVDAPPPWSSFNDELTLKAGDNFPYDVNPGN